MDIRDKLENLGFDIKNLADAGFHLLNNTHRPNDKRIQDAFELILMDAEASRKAFTNNKVRCCFDQENSKWLIIKVFSSQTDLKSMVSWGSVKYYRQTELKTLIECIIKTNRLHLIDNLIFVIKQQWNIVDKIKRLKLDKEIEDKFMSYATMSSLI